jgi:hypothetical protein
MKMANETIRRAAQENGVRLWEVAERWGVHDVTFCKKMRHEFTKADTRRALALISEIAADRHPNCAEE